MTPAQTIAALRRARALVARKGGWCQGAHNKKVGRITAHCAEGACINAAGEARRAWLWLWLWDALYDVASPEAGLDGLVLWNDAPGRTQAEVVALFDRAITKLEKRA